MTKVNLTATEIGLLWTQYMQNSIVIPILNYFEKHVEDEDIKPLISIAKEMAEKGVTQCSQFFEEEEMPLPNGYSEEDLNPHAPQLFTDPFVIFFLENMGKVGLASDSLSLGSTAREDVRTFFSNRVESQMSLYNQCVDTGLTKGLYLRAPQIAIQHQVDYLKEKSYLSPFHKRSLNTIEVAHLFENVKTNTLGEGLCQAFAQTTKNKTIKKYMKKGKKIAANHRKQFSNLLDQSGVIAPMTSSNLITTTTDPIFSDRLMIYLMSILSAAGHGNYSTASSASLRYDIVFTYQRLSVEIALFAKDGLDIMIENGWFEEPPQAPDRPKLIQ